MIFYNRLNSYVFRKCISNDPSKRLLSAFWLKYTVIPSYVNDKASKYCQTSMQCMNNVCVCIIWWIDKISLYTLLYRTDEEERFYARKYKQKGQDVKKKLQILTSLA